MLLNCLIQPSLPFLFEAIESDWVGAGATREIRTPRYQKFARDLKERKSGTIFHEKELSLRIRF
jgi:hypothetical protein